MQEMRDAPMEECKRGDGPPSQDGGSGSPEEGAGGGVELNRQPPPLASSRLPDDDEPFDLKDARHRELLRLLCVEWSHVQTDVRRSTETRVRLALAESAHQSQMRDAASDDAQDERKRAEEAAERKLAEATAALAADDTLVRLAERQRLERDQAGARATAEARRARLAQGEATITIEMLRATLDRHVPADVRDLLPLDQEALRRATESSSAAAEQKAASQTDSQSSATSSDSTKSKAAVRHTPPLAWHRRADAGEYSCRR